MTNSIIEAAAGRWPDLLTHLAGLTSQQLTNQHQPCPLCGGEDRYRFDDIDGSGSWFCNQCGGKDQRGGAGNGMDLLMRKTGWSFAEACQRIQSHLNLIPEPPTAGAEHIWRYNDVFLVCRFPGKKIRPLWWDGTAWRWKAPPSPRPLYWARRHNTAPVLICEGEKATDAAAKLFPTAACCTWPSGCKAIDKADWSPLAGRRITLWPDADDVGREAMAKLASRLIASGVEQVRIVKPPSDAPEGWDLADADWTPSQAAAHLKAHRSAPITAPQPQEPPAVTPEVVTTRAINDASDHFTCLGFDGDNYYYQPNSTGQVVRLSRSSHTGTNLVAIAPLAYWESIYPSKTGVNWTAAAASLFAKQAAAGVYSPDRIRGRGAWIDEHRILLHLGDRLIVDGLIHPITRPFQSSYLYQRSASLRGPSNADPLTVEEAIELCHLAERFRWEVPASGLLLAGWVALAPVCGALRWRPHIWLTAAAGSGKSAILDRYVSPLLGDMSLHVAGNTSEAGLRQTLRADALPVIFDEAESNEKADQQRMQSILGLARVASSESHAHLLKGSPGGDVTRFTIRSMFLMSSVATALKQGADRSRFAQLTLRNPTEAAKDQRAAHWEALDRDLDRHASFRAGRRLQARIAGMIPAIHQSIDAFTRAAAERFDSQRLGDQYGTLLAGAWALMADHPATIDDARQLIDQNDWEPYSQATEVPDERRCIQRILQHQIRVEVDGRGHTRTLGELVEIAMHHRADVDVQASQAADAMGRHGVKVDAESRRLIVSNNAEAVARILSDTPWAHSWATVLTRLPGATKTGAVRFSGAGTVSRAVALQIADL